MKIEYGKLYKSVDQKWTYVVPTRLIPDSKPSTIEFELLGTKNQGLVYECSFFLYFKPASDEYIK